jgi:IS30 family transposase
VSKYKRDQRIGRIDIDQRTKSVEERKIITDLEIDLMIGAGHKGALLTINDRATGNNRCTPKVDAIFKDNYI